MKTMTMPKLTIQMTMTAPKNPPQVPAKMKILILIVKNQASTKKVMMMISNTSSPPRN